MTDYLEPIIRAANTANKANPGDYYQNGLLMCCKCNTAKQTKVNFAGVVERIVGCMCACEQEKDRKEEALRKRREEMDKMERLRSVGITNQLFRDVSFEKDDGKNPGPMEKLRRYAEKWPEMQEKNIGLLLYGGVGTGKSYGAACIANRLIENLVPVLMTNFSSVLNAMYGFHVEDKNAYIADMMRYKLLILDDFGMERNSQYALEQVYNVIDSRYRSGKPLIVTTNLSRAELESPGDVDHARIYDRVLEMCVPINFGNSGRRAGYAQKKLSFAAELLTEGAT